MSRKSNDNGRAYEFAFFQQLILKMREFGNCEYEENKSYFTNERAYQTNENKEILIKSSKSAIKEIIKLEPILIDNNDVLEVNFQDDGKGKNGDVRDIVICCEKLEYEIGFSLKHNHKAIKHSRLSDSIDFAQEWYSCKCSEKYWNDVKPIFAFLRENKGRSWNFVQNKNKLIYRPILLSFRDEILSIKESISIKKLCRYLIGCYDFYKIISSNKEACTYIQTFNFDGHLGKSSTSIKSVIKIPVLETPTKILYCDLESDNRVILCLDKGWQFSFRIHNASSKIEPSLKFDISLIGMPNSILCLKCMWEN